MVFSREHTWENDTEPLDPEPGNRAGLGSLQGAAGCLLLGNGQPGASPWFLRDLEGGRVELALSKAVGLSLAHLKSVQPCLVALAESGLQDPSEIEEQ